MAVKTEIKLAGNLLSNSQYFGTIATVLYNWPLFAGALGFSVVTITLGIYVEVWWRWLLLASGGGVLGSLSIIVLASFIVYDWGIQRDYDRLVELGNLGQANVVVDITCGKLRGTRGILSHFMGGHYFLLDIYDPTKMPDTALRRARELEPPLEAERRIYQRTGQPNRLPIPHNWVDVIYCGYCLHEIQDSTDREAIFAEFARMLKPTGRLLIAEHDRDWCNFMAFGPGAWSFFSAKTWQNHFQQANLGVKHHERWRGLVNLWVVEKDKSK